MSAIGESSPGIEDEPSVRPEIKCWDSCTLCHRQVSLDPDKPVINLVISDYVFLTDRLSRHLWSRR